jgi:hypothetical protein
MAEETVEEEEEEAPETGKERGRGTASKNRGKMIATKTKFASIANKRDTCPSFAPKRKIKNMLAFFNSIYFTLSVGF